MPRDLDSIERDNLELTRETPQRKSQCQTFLVRSSTTNSRSRPKPTKVVSEIRNNVSHNMLSIRANLSKNFDVLGSRKVFL